MSKIELAVFDMDGCLYRHKDPDHHTREGFYQTRLGHAVSASILDLITAREEPDDIEDIYVKAISDDIGPSRYLGQRYSMSRTEYFDQTWGAMATTHFIDDRDIADAARVVQAFQDREIRLHLLTAAPSVWAQKVLGHLGLVQSFEAFSYGENFGKKAEVFQRIAHEVEPATVLSIGDEYENDIVPAAQLGMQTYLVSNDSPLIGVIERLT